MNRLTEIIKLQGETGQPAKVVCRRNDSSNNLIGEYHPASNDGTATLWMLPDAEADIEIRHESQIPVLAAALAPDTSHVAIITGKINRTTDHRDDRQNIVTIINAQDGVPLQIICEDIDNLSYLAYSPDGKWLTVGENNTRGDARDVIYLCDTQDNYRIVAATEPIGGTWKIQFSPDSTKMLAVGGQWKPTLWKLTTQTQRWQLRDVNAMGIAFHPGGDRVLIARGDGNASIKATLYAVQDARELITVEFNGLCTAPTFSPDGFQLIELIGSGLQKHRAQIIHAKDWTITDKTPQKEKRLRDLNEYFAERPPQ